MPFFLKKKKNEKMVFFPTKVNNPFRGESRLITSRCYSILQHVNVYKLFHGINGAETKSKL